MTGLRGGVAAGLALFTGVGSFVLAVLSGLLLFLGAGSGLALAARALLLTALLVLAVRICLARCATAARPITAGVGLLGGYLLGLGWLSGSTYVARAVTDSAVLAAVLDLALWLAVGPLALRLVPPGDAKGPTATGYY